MVVTATASVTGTMGTQLLHVCLQNYGKYRQLIILLLLLLL